MKSSQTADVYQINALEDRKIVPETRRGTPVVHKSQTSKALSETMSKLESDEYFHTIKRRIESFTQKTHADLDALNVAIENGDVDGISETARRMTDHTGRMGAMKMMRLCIALQMLASRDMIEKAKGIALDLEREFTTLKSTLVQAG